MEKILGFKVKDKVTGFKGIVTSKVEYLNGCVQVCVKPQTGKDGKMPDGQYIDIQQVEKISKTPVVELKTDDTGGPQSDCPKL